MNVQELRSTTESQRQSGMRNPETTEIRPLITRMPVRNVRGISPATRFLTFSKLIQLFWSFTPPIHSLDQPTYISHGTADGVTAPARSRRSIRAQKPLSIPSKHLNPGGCAIVLDHGWRRVFCTTGRVIWFALQNACVKW